VDGAVSAGLSSRSHEIVQLTREALSNITRHSRAKHAAVRLSRRGATAILAIEDDGIGFDARRSSTGSGLRNMRERAVGIGGSLRISSSSGKGTKLRFTFPA
jgi:signal transduction histidine kinase